MNTYSWNGKGMMFIGRLYCYQIRYCSLLCERRRNLNVDLYVSSVHVTGFSALFLFWKKKVEMGLWDHHAACIAPLINLWMPETWCVYHGTWAHLSGVLHKSPPISPCVCIPLSLLDNDFVKTLPRQWIHTRKNRRIVWRVFCAVRAVRKESKRLFLPRTSCYFIVVGFWCRL
jgi:hypothetical protein